MSIKVRFVWPHGGKSVRLAGAWNKWQGEIMHLSDHEWVKEVKLDAGIHQYKFIVDGNWFYDLTKETTIDPSGNVNNVVKVSENETESKGKKNKVESVPQKEKPAEEKKPQDKPAQEKKAQVKPQEKPPSQEKGKGQSQEKGKDQPQEKGKGQPQEKGKGQSQEKGKGQPQEKGKGQPQEKGKGQTQPPKKSQPEPSQSGPKPYEDNADPLPVFSAPDNWDKHRTHTCGELRIGDVGKVVKLCGWVQVSRDKNHFCFVDLRDRYGITQLVISEENPELYKIAVSLGREFVISAHGKVVERSNKSKTRETGDIEIVADEIKILNESKTPPFKIEDQTDGQEDLRMKYRYLDIRRNPVRNNLVLRHQVGMIIRNYLTSLDFIDIETPVLIKSTPEGARDFVVPSRMNPGTFYALPQSPQTFKQLLMVGGIDRYFQIVKCFRDEELRADRQPEFTQIDCEMSFVDQQDIIETFEPMIRHIFKEVINVELPNPLPHMTYADAMNHYGCDKPDTRFGMKIHNVTELVKGVGFPLFDNAAYIGGFAASLGDVSQKKLKDLTTLAKSKEIGGEGLYHIKHEKDGSFKSGVKQLTPQICSKVAQVVESKPGDCILLFAGPADATLIALGRFRLDIASQLNLRDPNTFSALWVVDFPLLEWDPERNRWQACHHPFTSANPDDIPKLDTDPGSVRARAYDLVINGIEVGGGSIRMFKKDEQLRTLKLLGFTEEQAEHQFGFLMRAFQYGAPPHGGLAFGFDRLCSIVGKEDSIRPFIAFPKNRDGRDTMIEAPSPITAEQLKELYVDIVIPTKQI